MKPYKVTVIVYVNATNINEAEKTVTNIVNSHAEVTGSEVTYIRENTGLIQPKATNTPSISPMEFDEFSKKYTDYRLQVGDKTSTEDLTAAYATYCSNPAGHWISKVKE